MFEAWLHHESWSLSWHFTRETADMINFKWSDQKPIRWNCASGVWYFEPKKRKPASLTRIHDLEAWYSPSLSVYRKYAPCPAPFRRVLLLKWWICSNYCVMWLLRTWSSTGAETVGRRQIEPILGRFWSATTTDNTKRHNAGPFCYQFSYFHSCIHFFEFLRPSIFWLCSKFSELRRPHTSFCFYNFSSLSWSGSKIFCKTSNGLLNLKSPPPDEQLICRSNWLAYFFNGLRQIQVRWSTTRWFLLFVLRSSVFGELMSTYLNYRRNVFTVSELSHKYLCNKRSPCKIDVCDSWRWLSILGICRWGVSAAYALQS